MRYQENMSNDKSLPATTPPNPTDQRVSQDSSQNAPSSAENTKAQENMPTATDSTFAAWSVVIGGFVTLFCSFGFLNNFAAFQNYYFTNTLRGYLKKDLYPIQSFKPMRKCGTRFNPKHRVIMFEHAIFSGLYLNSYLISSTSFYAFVVRP